MLEVEPTSQRGQMATRSSDTASRPKNLRYLENKSSAVAEMGDRLATVDMDRKLRGCYIPLFLGGGEAGPHLTQCRLGLGLPLYQVAS